MYGSPAKRHGIDPLSDVAIEEVVPPRMPSYLVQGRLDAVMSPEPFGELIVGQGQGFLHTSSEPPGGGAALGGRSMALSLIRMIATPARSAFSACDAASGAPRKAARAARRSSRDWHIAENGDWPRIMRRISLPHPTMTRA